MRPNISSLWSGMNELTQQLSGMIHYLFFIDMLLVKRISLRFVCQTICDALPKWMQQNQSCKSRALYCSMYDDDDHEELVIHCIFPSPVFFSFLTDFHTLMKRDKSNTISVLPRLTSLCCPLSISPGNGDDVILVIRVKFTVLSKSCSWEHGKIIAALFFYHTFLHKINLYKYYQFKWTNGYRQTILLEMHFALIIKKKLASWSHHCPESLFSNVFFVVVVVIFHPSVSCL